MNEMKCIIIIVITIISKEGERGTAERDEINLTLEEEGKFLIKKRYPVSETMCPRLRN